MSFSKEEQIRYSRHFVLKDFGIEAQEKLKKAKVLIIGCGGLGSPSGLYLAAAGVGTIGLADHDRVSLSNLQRQILFTTGDIQQSKSEASRKNLDKLNPEINIISYIQRIDGKNIHALINDYDIILDCTDNFDSRYLISDTCKEIGRPLVYGSVHEFMGQVAVFSFNGSPTYRDLYPHPPAPEAIPNCEQQGVLGAVAGIIGCHQAIEAIKIITGIGEPLIGKLLIYEALTGESRIIKYSHSTSSNTDNTEKNRRMIKEITVRELQQMMQGNEPFQLIDVREPYESEIATLNGMLIPLGQIADNTDKILTDKKVIVHCRSGARSAQAVKFLQEKLQHAEIYNLKGGIIAWANEIDPKMETY